MNGEYLSQPAWIDIFKDEAGKDWRDHFDFDNRTGTNIPFGIYHVEASYPRGNLADFSGTVEVFQKHVLLVVGIGWGELMGDFGEREKVSRTEVKGIIKGLPETDAEQWCKIMAIFGQNQYESSLRNGSEFDFGPVAVGNYMMVCASGKKLLFTAPVMVNRGLEILHLKAPALRE